MIELAVVDTPASRPLASAVLSRLAAELLRQQVCGCGEPKLAMPHFLHECDEVFTKVEPLEMEVADWNALFSAVAQRLKQSVCDPIVIPIAPPDPVGRIQHVVLECVEALDLLQSALAHERARTHLLGVEVASLRANLLRHSDASH